MNITSAPSFIYYPPRRHSLLPRCPASLEFLRRMEVEDFSCCSRSACNSSPARCRCSLPLVRVAVIIVVSVSFLLVRRKRPRGPLAALQEVIIPALLLHLGRELHREIKKYTSRPSSGVIDRFTLHDTLAFLISGHQAQCSTVLFPRTRDMFF